MEVLVRQGSSSSSVPEKETPPKGSYLHLDLLGNNEERTDNAVGNSSASFGLDLIYVTMLCYPH